MIPILAENYIGARPPLGISQPQNTNATAKGGMKGGLIDLKIKVIIAPRRDMIPILAESYIGARPPLDNISQPQNTNVTAKGGIKGVFI